MLAGANRLFWWTDTVLAFTADELFHQPIFERMETDHHQTPSRRQGSQRHGKHSLDSLQLLVDRDAQGLKGSRCRVDSRLSGASTPGPSQALHNDVGQLGCASNRSGSHNGAGQTPGCPFFAVPKKQIGEIMLGQRIQQIGCCRTIAARIEAHIQWGIGPKRETTFSCLKLHRGGPQIQQNALHLAPSHSVDLRRQLRIGGLDQLKPILEWTKPFSALLQCMRVQIEPEQQSVRGAGLQDAGRMTAETDRAIQVAAACLRFEKFENFLVKYGLVHADTADAGRFSDTRCLQPAVPALAELPDRSRTAKRCAFASASSSWSAWGSQASGDQISK